MSSEKVSSYIVSEATRKQLTDEMVRIFTQNAGAYQAFIQRSYYKSALDKLERSAGKTNDPKLVVPIVKGSKPTATPAEYKAFARWYAEGVIAHALGKSNEQPKLELPINVSEQQSDGALRYYRAFGGNAKSTSTWWMAEDELIKIFTSSAVRNETGHKRQKMLRDLMLSSSFVHPQWNAGDSIARLTVPAGVRIPVIIGMGSWRTTSAELNRDRGANANENKERARQINADWSFGRDGSSKGAFRVLQLGMLPRLGPQQWYLPLYEKSWIKDVADNDPFWPFGVDLPKSRLQPDLGGSRSPLFS